jgi:hypothetical protein
MPAVDCLTLEWIKAEAQAVRVRGSGKASAVAIAHGSCLGVANVKHF